MAYKRRVKIGNVSKRRSYEEEVLAKYYVELRKIMVRVEVVEVAQRVGQKMKSKKLIDQEKSLNILVEGRRPLVEVDALAIMVHMLSRIDALEHVEKTNCQVEMEKNKIKDLSIEKDYEDEEGNEDGDEIIECALEEGDPLECVPWGTQVAFGEVLEEDYACKDVNNQLEVVSEEDIVVLATIKGKNMNMWRMNPK